jgi:hypothetical protein
MASEAMRRVAHRFVADRFVARDRRGER